MLPLKPILQTLKEEGERLNLHVQVAGGVPAMCDGITQGEPGMELSLFSRDTIALATAIGLSHNVFDSAICMGTCDKIVPGLLIGALQFGHLPIVFMPGGPMSTGISNVKKTETRQAYAAGEIQKIDLLNVEQQAYHSAGTCTFFGQPIQISLLQRQWDFNYQELHLHLQNLQSGIILIKNP